MSRPPEEGSPAGPTGCDGKGLISEPARSGELVEYLQSNQQRGMEVCNSNPEEGKLIR